MKFLILVLLAAPGWAWAKPFVCFTGDKVASMSLYELAGNSDGGYGGQIFLAGNSDGGYGAPIELARWNPSCEAVKNAATGLKATALVLSGTSWGLACTGVGLPATVWLQGASIGTSVLGLVVGELPCDPGTQNAEVKRLAQLVVCEELNKQGIGCSL